MIKFDESVIMDESTIFPFLLEAYNVWPSVYVAAATVVLQQCEMKYESSPYSQCNKPAGSAGSGTTPTTGSFNRYMICVSRGNLSGGPVESIGSTFCRNIMS